MKKLLFILPFLLVLSCSVQKRKYQKGFYVDWHKQKTETLAAKPSSKTKEQSTRKEHELTQARPTQKDVLQVSTKNELTTHDLATKQKVLLYDEPCDQLIYKDGTEAMVKVIEITPNEIKYKKCENLEGPVYSTKKSELFMIKYANGTREVFKSDNAPKTNGEQTNQTYLGPPKTHPLSIASLILGILSLIPYIGLVSAILAIIFGNIALRKIVEQPKYYEGTIMAKVGKILGIILLSIYASILLIVIVLILLLAFL